MFVGEIGMPRREFLYDICGWETRCIINGYRKRDKLKHQLMAECAYAAIYTMRDPKGKTVADLFPQIFDDDDENEAPPLTDEDAADLQALIDAENANIKSETQQ